uniref:U1-type domain-containing protein n=2 Tax=Rhodnius prolixus TaxID=13249 RepID=T1HSI5_RHOPR
MWNCDDCDENSSFQKRNFTMYNFNRGRSASVQRSRKRRSYSVDSRRSHRLRNFDDLEIGNFNYKKDNERFSPFLNGLHWEPYQKKSSSKVSPNAVIKKMMTLLWEKKKIEANKPRTKFIKREPLPPFTGTTSIGDEGVVEGFFCKFCNVYLQDKQQSEKHLLTKSHFKKYLKHEDKDKSKIGSKISKLG